MNLLFDITWVSSFVFLNVLPFIFPDLIHDPVLDLIFPAFVGIPMLFSKKLKQVSYIAKGLWWICYYILKPQTPYNHIIWGSFLMFFTIMQLFFPSAPPTEREMKTYTDLHQSYDFWISIFIVILINVLIGIYTVKKEKEKNKRGQRE